MATTTITGSLAAAAVQPPANHVVNVVSGQASLASLSASGSGMALLCVIPPNAKNVQLEAYHTSGGETACVMNYGYRTENGSLSASALMAGGLADVTVGLGKPINMSPDDATSERRRFVTATKLSGTAGAAAFCNFRLTYTF